MADDRYGPEVFCIIGNSYGSSYDTKNAPLGSQGLPGRSAASRGLRRIRELKNLFECVMINQGMWKNMVL